MSNFLLSITATRATDSVAISGTPINDLCVKYDSYGSYGITMSNGRIIAYLPDMSIAALTSIKDGFQSSSITFRYDSSSGRPPTPVWFRLESTDKIGTRTEHQFNSGTEFTFESEDEYCPYYSLMTNNGGKFYYRSDKASLPYRCPRISELDANNVGEMEILVSGSSSATKILNASFLNDTSMQLSYIMYSNQNSDTPVTKIFSGFTTGITFGTNATYNSVKFGTSGNSFTYGAFYGCSSIINATVYCGAKSCPNNMFRACTNLTFANLDASTDGIYNYGFYNCKKLEKVLFNSSVSGNSVTSIGNYAFRSACTITTLYLDNLKTIGDYAFKDCSALTTLTSTSGIFLPSGLTSLGKDAFYYCNAITSVTIPNGITTIPDLCFYGCKGLQSVIFDGNINSIGTSAFTYCTSLTSVTFNGTVENVGNSAFQQCSSLTECDVSKITKSIGKQAFLGTALSSITVNETVTDVGDSAFQGCTSLTYAYVYGNLGKKMFYSCTSLTGVTLNKQTSIPLQAFMNANLLDVVLPNTITSIDSGAFYYNTGLTELIVPSGVTTFNTAAISGCTSLKYVVFLGDTDSISIGGTLPLPDSNSGVIFNPIGSDDSLLGGYDIPSGWTVQNMVHATIYGRGTFSILSTSGLTYTDGLGYFVNSSTARNNTRFYSSTTIRTNHIDIPLYNLHTDDTLTLSASTFANTSIKSITLPYNMSRIGTNSFSGCTQLTDVDIKTDTLAYLGGYAFSGCTAIKEIELPQITTMGQRIFVCDTDFDISNTSYTSKLTSITYKGTTYPTASQYTFAGVGRYGTLYHPNVSTTSNWLSEGTYFLGYYKWADYTDTYDTFVYNITETGSTPILYSTTGFDTTKNIVVDGIETAMATAYTFTTTGLHTVKIASTTACTIPSSSFLGMTNLYSVSIGNVTNKIGLRAFKDCTGLTGITMPNVTSFGTYTFSGCTSLINAKIPTGVTSIPTALFYYCGKLTDINIPDNVTTIDGSAFLGCSGATSLYISKNVTSIPSNCFNMCSGITSIDIHTGITSIGMQAFTRNASITSVTIPDGASLGGSSIFAYCTSLSEVNLGNGMTSIPTYTFSGCTSLTGITIPSTITSLSTKAFLGCSSLVYIHAKPTTAPSISNDTFQGVHTGGTLEYDTDSTGAYSSTWLSTSTYYLGYYSWNDANGNVIQTTFNATSGTLMDILNNGASLDGITKIKIYSGDTIYEDWTPGDGLFGRSYTPTVTGTLNIDFYCDSTLTTLPSFYNCLRLLTINIPSSITSLCTNNFNYCTGLTSVYFEAPSNITTIPNDCFSLCTNLNTLNINLNVITTIGDYAFYAVANYNFGDVTFGNNITSIGDSSFGGCRFNSITFTSINITSIPNSCFNSITNYDEDITYVIIDLGNYVTNIGDNAFNYADIKLSDNMKDLLNDDEEGYGYYDLSIITNFGRRCFSNCDYLGENIILPLGPDIVYDTYSFEVNASLKHIVFRTIGSNGYTSFNGEITSFCPYYLEDYYIDELIWTYPQQGRNLNPHPNTTYVNTFPHQYPSNMSSHCDSSIIYVPYRVKTNMDSTTDGQAIASNWEGYGWTLIYYPATMIYYSDGTVSTINVTGILTSSYITNKTNITKVVIGNTVTGIGQYAFASCHSLTSITIPDSVETIGGYAFISCDSLTSITIPDSVGTIGTYAFYYCTSLTSITIPDSVETIGTYAFSDCTSLTSITIPDSVETIGGYAFYNCTSLRSVTLSDSIIMIYISTFENCISLTGITIPDSVQTIGGRAFYNCDGIASITIPQSVTMIMSYAFKECGSLLHVFYSGLRLQWNNNIVFGTQIFTNSPASTVTCSDGSLSIESLK